MLTKIFGGLRTSMESVLGEFLKPVGAKLLLHCNLEISKLNIFLPAFYRQCFIAWSELNASEPNSSVQDIANQVIWNNKFFCVCKKSVYAKRSCESRLL